MWCSFELAFGFICFGWLWMSDGNAKQHQRTHTHTHTNSRKKKCNNNNLHWIGCRRKTGLLRDFNIVVVIWGKEDSMRFHGLLINEHGMKNTGVGTYGAVPLCNRTNFFFVDRKNFECADGQFAILLIIWIFLCIFMHRFCWNNLFVRF